MGGATAVLFIVLLSGCALAQRDARKKDSKLAQDLSCTPTKLVLPEIDKYCEDADPNVFCYPITFHDFSAVRPDKLASSEEWWNEDFERLYYCIDDTETDGTPADPSNIVESLVMTQLGTNGLPLLNKNHINVRRCPFVPVTCPDSGGSEECKDPPMTNEENFNEWYMSENDCNNLGYTPRWFTFTSMLPFFRENEESEDWVFDSSVYPVNDEDAADGGFFWLDDMGWQHQYIMDNKHNYGFTSQIHMMFEFEPTKHWTFSGDDDVWVFVNGILALDIGGVHHKATRTLTWSGCANPAGDDVYICSPGDATGMNTDTPITLEVGGVYTLDVFHAERHTWQSNFMIETNFVLHPPAPSPPPLPPSPPSPPPAPDQCPSYSTENPPVPCVEDDECSGLDHPDGAYHYSCTKCLSNSNRRKLMFGSYHTCICECIQGYPSWYTGEQ